MAVRRNFGPLKAAHELVLEKERKNNDYCISAAFLKVDPHLSSTPLPTEQKDINTDGSILDIHVRVFNDHRPRKIILDTSSIGCY